MRTQLKLIFVSSTILFASSNHASSSIENLCEYTEYKKSLAPTRILLAQRGFVRPHVEPVRPPPERLTPDIGRDSFSRNDFDSRAERSPKEVSIEGETYRVNSNTVLNEWDSIVFGKSYYLIQKLKPKERSGDPLYVLYKGDCQPSFYKGNENLQRLFDHALSNDGASVALKRPFKLIGSGTAQDFDAVMLTLSISSGGKDVIYRLTGDRYETIGGTPARSAQVRSFSNVEINRDGTAKYVGIQRVTGGFVKVTGATREAVAVVLASIREILVNFGFQFQDNGMVRESPLSDAERTLLIARLHKEIETSLNSLFSEEASQRQNNSGVEVEVKLSDEIIRWSITDNEIRGLVFAGATH